MNTNQRINEINMRKYREELKALLGDIAEIDIKALNKATLAGVRKVKQETPVDTGHLQRTWFFHRAKRKGSAVESEIYNNTEYAIYVNYGHRIVDKSRGFVKGKFMLEKSMAEVDKVLIQEFDKAVKEVKRTHGA